MEHVGTHERDGYVEIVFAGLYEQTGPEAVLAAVRDACEKGATRVLVDLLGVDGLPTVLDRYNFGVGVSNISKLVRLALVGRLGVVETAGLAEKVARNRGKDARRFLDKGKALAWLLSDDDPPTTI